MKNLKFNLLASAFLFIFCFAHSSETFAASSASAKLNVVTTITDLRAITAEVGGEFVNVESIAKGTQDPHFIEAKPSFMVKMAQADLVIAIGLELEVGWLPSVMRGSRNTKIATGQKGYLEVGPLVEPLEVPVGKVTRADGDVHPYGNPHVTLDPIRAGQIAEKISERLSDLDPAHKDYFTQHSRALAQRLQEKTKLWSERINKTGIKNVISYHKTLTYFFSRFHLQNPDILEPKPGIPPTSSHILEVIDEMKKQNINLILVENYFDPTVTEKIKQSLPKLIVHTVAVSVDGDAKVKSIDDLYENLVSQIEINQIRTEN